MPNEIAALSASTIGSEAVVIVGLWTSQTVHVLRLSSLEPLATVDIPSTYLIRSVLLVTFQDNVTHLFVGLGDGTLISYAFGPNGTVRQDSRKTVVLGREPLFMVSLDSAQGPSVFVSSDRPTIVSRDNDRLKYSTVSLKVRKFDLTWYLSDAHGGLQGINAATQFSSAAFPSCLALATSSSLIIGRTDEIQSVGIRTIPLGEDEPRRIAYDARTDTFGVVCLRREIDRASGAQETTGSFKIVDGKTFES